MVNYKWVRCPKCGHKLFRAEVSKMGTKLEIKCSSCKTVTVIDMSKIGGNEDDLQRNKCVR